MSHPAAAARVGKMSMLFAISEQTLPEATTPGHLTIIGFESIIRRDLSFKIKERILEVGFYALILLMVVVLFNDVVKILPNSVYNFFFGS